MSLEPPSTFIEWGVHYRCTKPVGEHITWCRDEEAARRDAKQRPAPNQTITLVRREIVIGAWEPAERRPRS